jgi:uncharacterized membrane protein (UPF0127 family)
MKGLIGRSSLGFAQGNALWIIPSNGIHTIGMSFPIDVAYLDSERRILRIYHSLAPFRIGALKFKAKSVLELPAGTLARTHTDVDDVLEFLTISNAPAGNASH